MVSIIIISIILLFIPVSVFAVDFKDHTGYIPDWAIEAGEFQALMTCLNMDSGTPDQKWCFEYSGYYNDKITKELEEYENQNYDDTEQDSENYFSNSGYIPQFNKKIFDDKLKSIPRTSYFNSLYDFSLIPPSKWSMHENAELIEGNDAAPIAFYSYRGHSDYTSNFVVLYLNLGPSNFDLLRFSSDAEVLDLFISELTTDKINVKIKQKNIESYIDGYKILIQYVETAKIDDKKFVTLQRETIAYLMASGDTYVLNFASTPEDFTVNVAEFETSANTFHVGPIEYEITPTKSESLPTCGSGTILKDGKCIVNSNSTPKSGGGCLIATATYGSELAPQVQQLREIRDNSLLQTSSGTSFMNSFNEFYYSFSPTIADWERESPVFKEAVRAFITPMISTLSIMTLAENGSDAQVLGLGISVIALNLGMYIVAPAVMIIVIKKKF